MKPHEFFLQMLVIFIGSLLAMLVWTLIVKSQVSAQLTAANPVNSVLGIFGSRPAS
jgi:hypothetical protein